MNSVWSNHTYKRQNSKTSVF